MKTITSNSTEKIYRILDANANRLREGLRVSEDITRFILEDEALSTSFKGLRHEVTKKLTELPEETLSVIQSRDSEGDIGRTSFIESEKKEEIVDVLIRNLKRAEEAARVIEEFLKLIDSKLACQFQSIRFQIYDLEKRTLSQF